MSSNMPGSAQGMVFDPDPPYSPIDLNMAQHLTHSQFADQIALRGENDILSWVSLASEYHRIKSGPNALTEDELWARVLNLTQDDKDIFYQHLPNAMALRLLAPRAGQEYQFESRTTVENGKKCYKYQCLAPGCTFNSKDKGRHMDGIHVKDIDRGLCCPYKRCQYKCYSTRVSELTLHCKGHKKKNERLQRQGKPITEILHCFL
ncbi:hypothetical protein DHEL01_v206673 [Diaporthe helianthi]|uniref:Uncharacterized protein n=1 Tax=Diaporthe helianthi TaxID=158607 RepID=A0A2P5HXH1_DIAHE|nr:hypothetical protein DHEL01_v206673 [Diaporthe helianthi]